MQDPLITLDEAVSIAKAAGFQNMNKRWFQLKIETGALDGKEGVVTYVAKSDVENLIDAIVQVGVGAAKSKPG
jgi:hypothetical protein